MDGPSEAAQGPSTHVVPGPWHIGRRFRIGHVGVVCTRRDPAVLGGSVSSFLEQNGARASCRHAQSPDTRVSAMLGQLYFYSWRLAITLHVSAASDITTQLHDKCRPPARTQRPTVMERRRGEAACKCIRQPLTARRVPRRKDSCFGHAAAPASFGNRRRQALWPRRPDGTMSDDDECWIQLDASLLATRPDNIGSSRR
jgi:hypothetical protein